VVCQSWVYLLIEFYESELGQIIYSWRSISVEPLIEHIKEVFRIDPLPIRGYQKAAAIIVLLSVFKNRDTNYAPASAISWSKEMAFTPEDPMKKLQAYDISWPILFFRL
jgi:hypothetical protein